MPMGGRNDLSDRENVLSLSAGTEKENFLFMPYFG
jgi:hypothetical protein